MQRTLKHELFFLLTFVERLCFLLEESSSLSRPDLPKMTLRSMEWLELEDSTSFWQPTSCFQITFKHAENAILINNYYCWQSKLQH